MTNRITFKFKLALDTADMLIKKVSVNIKRLERFCYKLFGELEGQNAMYELKRRPEKDK